jgi:hypothetical protein
MATLSHVVIRGTGPIGWEWTEPGHGHFLSDHNQKLLGLKMGWGTKDYITVGLSVFSLLLSLTTAFFSLMDRHNVFAAVDYDYIRDVDRHRVQVTFTNAGNRTMTVNRLKLVFYKYKAARPKCENLKYDESNEGAEQYGEQDFEFPDRFSPFVLKSGEAVFQNRYFNLTALESLRPTPNLIVCLYLRYVVSTRWGGNQIDLIDFSGANRAENGVSFRSIKPVVPIKIINEIAPPL